MQDTGSCYRVHSVLKNRKGQVDRLRILLGFFFFFLFLSKTFFIIIFQDIDFLWYIASSDNVLKTPA